MNIQDYAVITHFNFMLPFSTARGQCLAGYYHDVQKFDHTGLCKYTCLHTGTNTVCNDTNDAGMRAPESLFADINYLISASATDFTEKH